MPKILQTSILIVVSLAVGGAGGYLFSQQQGAKQTATKSEPTAQISQSNDSRTMDKASGFNMTAPDMADELDSMPAGADIGWRYATYVIQMRNYEVAMARAAQEKATQPEVKQIAQEQVDANRNLVDKLYVLMKASGMSH